MKQSGMLLLLLLLFAKASTHAQNRKVITYQLMVPNFNTKVIKGTITEVYTTRRYGKTFWWVRIGADTLIHVWKEQLDTTTMKPGVNRAFYSIKRLDNSWWKKEKSEDYVKPKQN